MPRKITKNDCVGCRNDFYNTGGVTGHTHHCWAFDSADMIKRKKVHMNDVPPWKHKAILRPTCYRVSQYVFVNEDTTC